MPSDVDRLLARGEELIERSRTRTEGALATRTRKRREAEILARLGRIAAADAMILIAAITIGMFVPLGMFGALAVMMLLILATLFFASMPVTSAPRVEQLVQVPLKALPATTERWLETQRLALPAPARTLVDSIGVKLETLAPQLARLDDSSPAANEVRKLIGEQLPELVKGYGLVPEPLRTVPRNGMTPDQQLAQGLRVIDEEIAEMTAQLAQGDLDALATRGNFLQIKYKDDELG